MSEAQLDQLTAEGATVVPRCEVWLDGQQVDEVPVIAGTVTYEASARVVRSCQVQLLGGAALGPNDTLAPTGGELRLFRGARDWTGEVIERALGRYAFDASTVQRADQLVGITGYDYAQLVSDARWEVPFVVERNTNVVSAIVTAAESRLPPVRWRQPNVESSAATTPTVVWGEERENDPMADIRSLGRGDGLEVSFDREGRLTVASVPQPDLAAVRWNYTAGLSPTYLTGGRELTGRPYNVVVALGESEGDTPPVTATAEDDNPSSPSFIGRYRRPYFLTSSYIETPAQALRAARGELNRLLGLAEVVTLQVVGHPSLDVWQVLQAVDPQLGVDARYVIDRVELPLTPGPATLTTRRRRL